MQIEKVKQPSTIDTWQFPWLRHLILPQLIYKIVDWVLWEDIQLLHCCQHQKGAENGNFKLTLDPLQVHYMVN